MDLLNLITSLSVEEQDVLKNYVDLEINKLKQEIKKNYVSKEEADRFLDRVLRGR